VRSAELQHSTHIRCTAAPTSWTGPSHVQPHVCTLCAVRQAKVSDLGHNPPFQGDDAGEVIDHGLLLRDGNLLHRLTTQLHTFADSTTPVLQLPESVRSPARKVECEVDVPTVTGNSALPMVSLLVFWAQILRGAYLSAGEFNLV